MPHPTSTRSDGFERMALRNGCGGGAVLSRPPPAPRPPCPVVAGRFGGGAPEPGAALGCDAVGGGLPAALAGVLAGAFAGGLAAVVAGVGGLFQRVDIQSPRNVVGGG